MMTRKLKWPLIPVVILGVYFFRYTGGLIKKARDYKANNPGPHCPDPAVSD